MAPTALRVSRRARSEPRARRASRATPSPTSTSAPATSMPLSPRSGISTSPAAAAPRIEPSVFTPYTRPIARSPCSPAISERVRSGSVVPAQKVAGSITARQMP